MKKMITICAECKKILKTASGADIDRAFTLLTLDEEVVYSHGICNECVVKLYGSEILTQLGTVMISYGTVFAIIF